jgi:hypothetical protein
LGRSNFSCHGVEKLGEGRTFLGCPGMAADN